LYLPSGIGSKNLGPTSCQSKSAIQPRWVPKETLQDHAAMAGRERFVHGKIPSR
jgi:hypothetical protein